MSSLRRLGRRVGYGVLCASLAVAVAAPVAAQGFAAASLLHDCQQNWNQSPAGTSTETPCQETQITAIVEGYGKCTISTRCLVTEVAYSTYYSGYTYDVTHDVLRDVSATVDVWKVSSLSVTGNQWAGYTLE